MLFQKIVFIVLISSGFSVDDNFRMISSRACPETELVFQCTVDGDGGTYWNGTVLEECPQGRILIRHSQFQNGFSINEMCGDNVTVIVRTTSAVNNSYTTELIISVNERLNGSMIECTSDSGRRIGSHQIILSPGEGIIQQYAIQDLLQCAENSQIVLSQITKGQLSFRWSVIPTHCLPVNYDIKTANCGKCPDRVTLPHSFTCNISSTIPLVCTLIIDATFCGNALDNIQQLVLYLMKGYSLVPDIPIVRSIEVFSHFPLIRTTFNTLDLFNVSDNITLAISSYTIIYSDSISGNICGSAIIPASSCESMICNHVFEVSSPACHNLTYLNVSMSATNLLGDGPFSDPVVVSISLFSQKKMNTQSSLELMGVGFGVLLTTILLLIIVIGVLIQCKMKVEKEFKSFKKDHEKQMNTIYEEIKPIQTQPLGSITPNTEENLAYGCAPRSCI